MSRQKNYYLRPAKIVDTRTFKGPRGPGAHSVHPDGDPDGGALFGEVTNWIRNQLEHMISPRGNDAADAAVDLGERLAGLILEIAKDIAARKRIAWVEEELRKDRHRGE